MTTELEKQKSESIKKFELLKSSIDEQTSVLDKLKSNIVDENSSAIANQQLSKAKQLEDVVEKSRKEIKQPYWDTCNEIDALAKTIISPLKEKKQEVMNAVLEYDRKVQEKKKQELAELQKKQDEEIAAAKAKALKLAEDAKIFFNEAIDEIFKSYSMDSLSAAYVKYFSGYKDEYGPDYKAKIYSIGVAKKDVLAGKIATEAKLTPMYNEYKGIKEVVVIPQPEPTFETTAKVEQAKVDLSTIASNIKKKWTFEITDESKLDRRFLMPNEKTIKEALKQIESSDAFVDGQDYTGIPGLRFYQEKSVKVK